jgi:hypothetical protein
MFTISERHKKLFIQHFLLIFLFASLYYFAHLYIIDFIKEDGGLINPNKKNNKTSITFFDCFRFSLVTQTTVGYGSLVPTHILTDIINILQLLTLYSVIILSFF